MLIIQHFDKISSTYTYVITTDVNRNAIIIDPVFENIETYLGTLTRLNLKLKYAIDTHTHADHISGIGKLRDLTNCTTAIGQQSKVIKTGMRVTDGDVIECDGMQLKAIYTPGHTDDSYSFLLNNQSLFTGDTLLIGGSGRTDFQNGNPYDAYHSLHQKILTLPDSVLVYPAHDYKENTVSTIIYEKKHNPRLQAPSAEAYAEIMNHLNLPYPKLMDVAVPANIALGQDINQSISFDDEITAEDFITKQKANEIVGIDLREAYECKRDGVIPNTHHCPYTLLDEQLKPGNKLHELLEQHQHQLYKIVFICAFGERSALALKRVRKIGYKGMKHLQGGYANWIKAGGVPELKS